jgi:P4 family phage/plasmid primase-like protien
MRKYELKRWSRHRRDELEAWFRDDAPRLKERPPSGRLCLENGILDLETFELEEHGPEKWLSTVKIPIRYDPEAEGTAWQEHFASVLPEELHRAGVGTELFARLLTPATGKRKAILFKGPRDTGKSQTLRNLMRAIGASGGVTRYKLQELEQKAFSRARLFGKVANVNADLPARPLESTSVFKKITGGDAISAEHKHKTGFEFTPHCHLLFSSNHPLRVKSAADEEAFWDRWLVLPFTQQISEEEQESAEQIEERLQDPEELSAFLNRALALLPQVEENGIEETPEMELELRRMRRAGTADNESNAPTGDGHRSGDGHATAAPAPPQPTGSKKPANKKEKESKSDRHPPCQNEDNFISSETPAETPQTGKGDETPRRGDGSSSNTSTPAVSGDGHSESNGGGYVDEEDLPPIEEAEVLWSISGQEKADMFGFELRDPGDELDPPGEGDGGGGPSPSSNDPPPPQR